MTAGSTLGHVELVRIRLPLAAPWVTAAGTVHHRDVLLVRVGLGSSEGWGECVAPGEPTYTSEYVESAADVLARHLVPRLVAARPVGASQVGPALEAVKGHPMAKSALEAALLDAELRAEGRSLAEHLQELTTHRSPPHPRVVGGVALGITSPAGALVDEVARRVAEGYRRVKLKIRPGWDVEPVAAVRAAFPDLALQVDANGAYAALAPQAAVRAVAALDRFGLLLVEQPLADDDLVGHAALARAIRTPVCLDEAITSLALTEAALALGACQVVNLKPGRVGGYLEAVRIHDRCAAAGVPVWCGGMLETGVGRAANLALATLPNFTLPGDLSASGRFWAEDIVTDPARLEPDGTLRVPRGPGTGVEIVDLRPWLVERRTLA